MEFEFATASRIRFGWRAIEGLGPIAAQLGKRALVTSGVPDDMLSRIEKLLNANQVEVLIFNVDSEPAVDDIRQGSELGRASDCDLVIGIGGGSAIDTGKAIAALLTNPGDVQDYLEVIGKGEAIHQAPMPFIAIPTTAGTGAEVTRNAVIESPEQRVKVSLRSPLMLPRLALIDPELTLDLPPDITAYTGLDALTQLIEPFVSIYANPITDGFCREGITRASRALRRAYHYGEDPTAREDMSIASLLGGLALANAKLGAVHGFAGPIGGMYHAPHGAVCARLLPEVMRVNVRALEERAPESECLRRYQVIAQIVTGEPNTTTQNGVRWVKELCDELDIPALSKFGLRGKDFSSLVEKASRSSSMKGNPIELTDHELEEVLARAL